MSVERKLNTWLRPVYGTQRYKKFAKKELTRTSRRYSKQLSREAA